MYFRTEPVNEFAMVVGKDKATRLVYATCTAVMRETVVSTVHIAKETLLVWQSADQLDISLQASSIELCLAGYMT